MTPGPPVAEAALAQLVALVREETGNVIPRARFSFLEEIASRRARARGFLDGAAYVAALAGGELDGEWDQLVPLVTIKESYFFRAPQQFAAIERYVLPRLLAARGNRRSLRIWSAAAARGEEPATLALILAEHEALASWDWRVVATDLDGDALAAAERGLYGDRAVAQVPERLREKWFTRRGSLFELDPAIRSRIELRHVNLSHPPYRELPEGPFDLVLLRNVLIYFRRVLQRRVVSEVVRRLAPDGYLFLGASETLWQIFDRLSAVDLGECFAYRHPPEPEALARPTRAALPDRAEDRARDGERARAAAALLAEERAAGGRGPEAWEERRAPRGAAAGARRAGGGGRGAARAATPAAEPGRRQRAGPPGPGLAGAGGEPGGGGRAVGRGGAGGGPLGARGLRARGVPARPGGPQGAGGGGVPRGALSRSGALPAAAAAGGLPGPAGQPDAGGARVPPGAGRAGPGRRPGAGAPGGSAAAREGAGGAAVPGGVEGAGTAGRGAGAG